MDDKKKNPVKNIILTSSMIAGSVLGLSVLTANATETFRYSELGSGGELRSELLNNNSSGIIAIDLSCGENKKKADAKKDSKTKDAKCGEGKCGDDKKATTKKSSENKSMEGTCGEHKSDKATEKSKSDEKAKTDKDGDGNSGN